MNLANTLLFGIYPYICLAVFLVGSWLRYDREPYTWRSESSLLLRRGHMRIASNLFHVGILGIFFGHLAGLLTPVAVWHALGIDAPTKQLIAVLAGGAFGLICFVGLSMLIHRRLTEPRIRATTKTMDFVVLFLLLAQLVLGLVSILFSLQHMDGGEMIKLMTWSQRIVTFRADAASYVADVALVFKLHLLLGMTLFLVFPFSRLVHIWSGLASVRYLARPHQIVRAR
jgi:nitrate reductase gamma subunit